MSNPNNKAERVAGEILDELQRREILVGGGRYHPLGRLIVDVMAMILAREYPEGELSEDAVKVQVAALKIYDKLIAERRVLEERVAVLEATINRISNEKLQFGLR